MWAGSSWQVGIPIFFYLCWERTQPEKRKSCLQNCQNQGWLLSLGQTLVGYFSLQGERKFRISGGREPLRASVFFVCLFVSFPVVHHPDLTVAFSSFSRCGILWLTPRCQCLVMGVDYQHSAQSHRLPFVRGSWVTFLSGQGAMFCLLWNSPWGRNNESLT